MTQAWRDPFAESEARDVAEYRRLLTEEPELLDAHADKLNEEGAALLHDAERFISRYVLLPDGALLPLAVWVLATHCFEVFDVFPYLAITSPVPRCGKSTLLDLIGMFARNAIPASNISEAALFRTISNERPVLLLDEAEWLREKSERAQIIRNLLNAGHRSNASTIRCQKDGKVRYFPRLLPQSHRRDWRVIRHSGRPKYFNPHAKALR